MRLPTDDNVEVVDIEQLSELADITPEEAVELANEHGADPCFYEPDYGITIDSDFVINTLDIRRGDIFIIEDEDGETEAHKVKEDNQMSPGFETVHPDDNPGTMGWDRHDAGLDWDEHPEHTYGDLWLAWLRGNVIPLKEETRYVRVDTDETVNP